MSTQLFKLCIQITFIAVLLASSLSLIGCAEEIPKEKQVLESTYEYLIVEASHLQGVSAMAEMSSINYIFDAAILEANTQAVLGGDELGQKVELQIVNSVVSDLDLPPPSIWTGALKRIVKDKGDGLWAVFISEWAFEYNEETAIVTALNAEAANLLNRITLKTYFNSKYGYYVDYPPDWTVYDDNPDGVLIVSPSFQTDIFIEVNNQYFSSLEEHIFAKFLWLKSQYYEHSIIETIDLEDRGYTITRVDYLYVYSEGGQEWEARHYFIPLGDMVYGIVASATRPVFESLSHLYDPYTSFRFQQ